MTYEGDQEPYQVGPPVAAQVETATTDESLRHYALDVAIKIHGDSCDFGEIIAAAAAYEAYLRTGAVPTEDDDE